MVNLKPKISVIMSVYNGQLYLEEAIESILGQSFTDFEFIIVDDASNDSSSEIIKKYSKQDSRIRVHFNKKNLRLASSLNIGLGLARADLVARMDADDVSLPERLQVQYQFMQRNPQITVCGSYLSIYGNPDWIWRVPTRHEDIISRMIFESCIYHPTSIYRKHDVAERLGGYDPSFVFAQDYDLWQRLSELTKVQFANIPIPLLKFRLHQNVDRKNYKSRQYELAKSVRHRYLNWLGVEDANTNGDIHEVLVDPLRISQSYNFRRVEQWLDSLNNANVKNNLASHGSFRAELQNRLLSLCVDRARHGESIWARYLISPWAKQPIAERLTWSMRLLKMRLEAKRVNSSGN